MSPSLPKHKHTHQTFSLKMDLRPVGLSPLDGSFGFPPLVPGETAVLMGLGLSPRRVLGSAAAASSKGFRPPSRLRPLPLGCS